jgi:enoyl-CoA hydratase
MSEILYEVTNGIGVVIINRPSSRNAFNWSAQDQFSAVIQQAASDENLRVLIITAAGDKAFASGGDLKELAAEPGAETDKRLNQVMGEALARLGELPLPVIAAVQGNAVGGGCEIMTACDLRMASSSATFTFAQVKVGLTTGWGGTGRLVRLIGQSKATELLLTGRTFDAQEAYEMGFVHRLIPQSGDVRRSAVAWAELLAKLPREALAATKQLVRAAGQLSIEETYVLEGRLFQALWGRPDHLEALAALVEKRDARFGGVIG